jgi:hypothetical protein
MSSRRETISCNHSFSFILFSDFKQTKIYQILFHNSSKATVNHNKSFTQKKKTRSRHKIPLTLGKIEIAGHQMKAKKFADVATRN